MAEFPLEPQLAKTILLANQLLIFNINMYYRFQCCNEIMSVVSLLSV
jgi:HrpA-like RNA helicase